MEFAGEVRRELHEELPFFADPSDVNWALMCGVCELEVV